MFVTHLRGVNQGGLSIGYSDDGGELGPGYRSACYHYHDGYLGSHQERLALLTKRREARERGRTPIHNIQLYQMDPDRDAQDTILFERVIKANSESNGAIVDEEAGLDYSNLIFMSRHICLSSCWKRHGCCYETNDRERLKHHYDESGSESGSSETVMDQALARM